MILELGISAVQSSVDLNLFSWNTFKCYAVRLYCMVSFIGDCEPWEDSFLNELLFLKYFEASFDFFLQISIYLKFGCYCYSE